MNELKNIEIVNIPPLGSREVKAGIVGGAGYTGGEMLRILVNHPNVEIAFVNSKSNAGNPLYKVHTDLLGSTHLKFSDFLSDDIDVLFLCVGHGDAAKFLAENTINPKIKIIDLSQDYRIAKKVGMYFVNVVACIAFAVHKGNFHIRVVN